MSIKQRVQQLQYGSQGHQIGGGTGLKESDVTWSPTAISTYQYPRPWAIVDGTDLVEVMSQETNIPGMSPGFHVASREQGSENGVVLPVSERDIRLFTNEAAAREALAQQRTILNLNR
jgi:hypothetical protein